MSTQPYVASMPTPARRVPWNASRKRITTHVVLWSLFFDELLEMPEVFQKFHRIIYSFSSDSAKAITASWIDIAKRWNSIAPNTPLSDKELTQYKTEMKRIWKRYREWEKERGFVLLQRAGGGRTGKVDEFENPEVKKTTWRPRLLFVMAETLTQAETYGSWRRGSAARRDTLRQIAAGDENRPGLLAPLCRERANGGREIRQDGVLPSSRNPRMADPMQRHWTGLENIVANLPEDDRVEAVLRNYEHARRGLKKCGLDPFVVELESLKAEAAHRNVIITVMPTPVSLPEISSTRGTHSDEPTLPGIDTVGGNEDDEKVVDSVPPKTSKKSECIEDSHLQPARIAQVDIVPKSQNPPPVSIPFTRTGVPDELAFEKAWVGWRYGDLRADGKRRKPPYSLTTGLAFSLKTPDVSSFDATLGPTYAARGFAGAGFVFRQGAGYVGVDLDTCRNPITGQIARWAWTVIDRLDSYTEVSPSGTGVHIYCRGSLPGSRTIPRAGSPYAIEMYTQARYFCVTGVGVEGTPSYVCDRTDQLAEVYREYIGEDAPAPAPAPPAPAVTVADDELVIATIDRSRQTELFNRLFREGAIDGYRTPSHARMGLVGMLRFYACNNADQIDRIFRRSKLMCRKWDEVHHRNGDTEGVHTINEVIAEALRTNAPCYTGFHT